MRLRNPQVKLLLENFISLSVLKFLDLTLPLILTPFIIYRIGVVNFGIYGFALSLITYMRNFVQYGFTLSAVRDIAIQNENKEKINLIINRVLSVKIFMAFCMFAILIFLLSVFPKFGEYKTLYLFSFFFVVGDIMDLSWYFQGIQKMKLITFFNVISKSTFAIFVFTLLKNREDYVLLPLYQFLGILISSIFGFYYLIKISQIKIRLVGIYQIFLEIKIGFSTFITLFLPTLYSNTSTFLLGFFGDPTSVAYFVGGSRIADVFISFNTILTQVFYPFLNKMKSKFLIISKIIIVSGLVSTLVMLVTSKITVALILGSEMSKSVYIVWILSLSPLLMSLRTAFGVNKLLVNYKDTLYMKIAFISSISGLIAVTLLILKFNYIGAAFGIVFAQFIFAFLSYRYSQYFVINVDNYLKIKEISV
ncbi:MAG: oligosaccharide flippase family protein [Erythrobacter sp.]|nr:oligosaccharide flippase family protein [Erythrobacter sp.]